jgi:NO-binding membrane sensor protein with MHYT domain
MRFEAMNVRRKLLRSCAAGSGIWAIFVTLLAMANGPGVRGDVFVAWVILPPVAVFALALTLFSVWQGFCKPPTSPSDLP